MLPGPPGTCWRIVSAGSDNDSEDDSDGDEEEEEDGSAMEDEEELDFWEEDGLEEDWFDDDTWDAWDDSERESEGSEARASLIGITRSQLFLDSPKHQPDGRTVARCWALSLGSCFLWTGCVVRRGRW
jgi:hypothetical protein